MQLPITDLFISII